MGSRKNIKQEKIRGVEEDLVLKEEKVYVPKDKKLRLKVIQLYHDVLVTGHEER